MIFYIMCVVLTFSCYQHWNTSDSNESQTELLDNLSEKKDSVDSPVDENHFDDERIGFREATFTWTRDLDGFQTPSERQFALRIKGELLFKRDHMNLIVGPTGCGKTSLLMALLGMCFFVLFVNDQFPTISFQGEMHFMPSGPDSWYNLPRSSKIAYAAQESWVLNETIKVKFL